MQIQAPLPRFMASLDRNRLLASAADCVRHLQSILERGSVNLGAGADTERLMLLVTPHCQLRCHYCLVSKKGRAMSLEVGQRAVDWLMRSARPQLELQLFGGEPTLVWSLVAPLLDYTEHHRQRADRPVRVVLTTNGLELDDERLSLLAHHSVTILLSVDGPEPVHRRYRPASHASAGSYYERIDETLERLLSSSLDWFVNTVITPDAVDQLQARYRWARDREIPRLQLGYAVGVPWKPPQVERYLAWLVEVLRENRAAERGPLLFEWDNRCEPVILSDELIVDADGAVYHDAAIFLERAFPELRRRFRVGQLGELDDLGSTRWSLRRIYGSLLGAYPRGSQQHNVLLQSALFGAAKDLCVLRLAQELGRPVRAAR